MSDRHDLADDLDQGLAAMGLALTPDVQATLLDYLTLLQRWNRAYNLTAVKDPHAMVHRHLLDSLSVLPYLDEAPPGPLADVGSGAGLPGLPLALARPERDVLLVDSVGKKVRFLRQAVRELGLGERVRAVQGRVETLADETGRFAVVTARAFAPLGRIVQLAGHLLRTDGRILAMKGRVEEDELAGIPADWRVRQVTPLCVPGTEGARHLVVLQPPPPQSERNEP